MVSGRQRDQESGSRHGLDENRSYLSALAGRLVPQRLARRALAVDVRTDADSYAPGEPVELEVAIRNRLPVVLRVTTPGRRLWGWAVDGELEASDESRFAHSEGGVLVFRPRERKLIRHRWDGRRKRVGERTRFEPLEPGDHELTAFVATEEPRPSDRTTFRVESTTHR